MRARGALLAAVILAQAVPAGAAPQILLRSGDAAADGLRLDGFRLPVASSAGQVALLATTSGILREDGGVLSVVAKTGDPLPAPLQGTFGALANASIADGGAIAFAATLDSPSAAAGIFVAGPGGVVARVLQPGPVGAVSIDRPALNQAGDLIYGAASRLSFLASGSDTPVVVARRRAAAPGGGTFQRIGPAVVNNHGLVAFAADVRGGPSGIFTWDATSGIAVAAEEGEASPIPGASYGSFNGRDDVSINDGQLAFVAALAGSAAAGLFVRDLAGGVTTPLAKVGDLVGAEALTDIRSGFVGLNSLGEVAFLGVFASGVKVVLASGGALSVLTADHGPQRSFAPRLGDGGEIAWLDDGSVAPYASGSVRRVAGRSGTTPLGGGFSALLPSINGAGAVAFGVSRGALYLLAPGGARPVVEEGDQVQGFGTIASFGRVAFGGETLVFSALDPDGYEVIARVGDAGASKVVAAGDPGPKGGILDLGDERIAASGDAVVFSSTLSSGTIPAALFTVDAGAVERVARTGQRAARHARFASFADFAFLGRGVAFAAGLSDGRIGIFLRRGRRTAPLALSGSRAPGGGKLGAFGGLATSGPRLLFSANLLASATTTRLFLAQGGRLRKVAGSDEAAPGGGLVGDLLSFALATRTPVFLASQMSGDSTPRALFSASGRSLVPLVRVGDPAPGGGAIAALDEVAATGAMVLVQAELTGAPAARALFEVPAGGP